MSQNPQDPHQGAPQYGQSAPEGAPQYGSQQHGQNAPEGAPQYGGQQYEAASGKPQGPAPSAVKKGTLLVYVACALGLIGGILSALGQSVNNGSDGVAGAAGSVGGIFGILIVMAIGAVTAFLASRGANWARIVSVVFGGIAVLRLLMAVAAIFLVQAAVSDGAITLTAAYYIGAALEIIADLVYIVGNIMYLLKPASAWYRSGKYPQQPVY